jgi:ubiquinone/menaquinone biosynthesis C-methylase UbiE
LEETSIATTLKTPHTLDEIADKSGINNRQMLQSLLDTLVGRNVLRFERGEYRFLKKPTFSQKEYDYIAFHYPGAVEWSHFLYDRAKPCLLKGSDHVDTGFDDDNSLRLWDSILEGPLYAMRQLAINELTGNLKENARVADIGSGSGIALVDILSKSDKDIQLTGFDYSSKMLERSKERIRRFIKKSDSDIRQENAEKVLLIRHNLLDDFPKGHKFDAVFISLVINHIPPEKRGIVFDKIKSVMKPSATLVIFQLVNQSKFDRVFSDWLLQVVPSHKGFPVKDEFITMLSDKFDIEKVSFRGNIIVAKNGR